MKRIEVPAWLKAAIEDDLRWYPISKATLNSLQASPSSGVHFDVDRLPPLRRVSKDDPVPNVGLGSSAHRLISSSDPTFAAVAKVLPRDLGRLIWICGAIGDVLAAVNQETRDVIRLFYFQRMRLYDVADRMGMSTSTVRRTRYDVVGAIAYRMGLVRRRWWIGVEIDAYRARLRSREKDGRKLGESKPQTEL